MSIFGLVSNLVLWVMTAMLGFLLLGALRALALLRGGAVILPSPQFEAEAVLRAIHAERAIVLGVVPTMLVALLEHSAFDSFDLSSLRVLWTGGSPSPVTRRPW